MERCGGRQGREATAGQAAGVQLPWSGCTAGGEWWWASLQGSALHVQQVAGIGRRIQTTRIQTRSLVAEQTGAGRIVRPCWRRVAGRCAAQCSVRAPGMQRTAVLPSPMIALLPHTAPLAIPFPSSPAAPTPSSTSRARLYAPSSTCILRWSAPIIRYPAPHVTLVDSPAVPTLGPALSHPTTSDVTMLAIQPSTTLLTAPCYSAPNTRIPAADQPRQRLVGAAGPARPRGVPRSQC